MYIEAMVLLGNPQFQNTIFKCKSTFVPAKAEEPEYEEEDDHKDGGLVFIPPMCNYLPGERLLQKVNKASKKAKKTRRENNLSVDEVSTITHAMSKIMAQMS
jgi:hypothetical protein